MRPFASSVPTLIAGHIRAGRGTESERAAFQRQAAEDWKNFVSLRASELRHGGYLVIVLPGLNDDGVPEPALEIAMDHANELLEEMVSDGVITAGERARMVIGSFARRRCDLLAPFRSDAPFHGLAAETCDIFPVEDPAWADYQRDGNKDLLASRQARAFRATFAPSLASALIGRGDEERCAFADRLEHGLKCRLAKQPRAAYSLVQTIVLTKKDRAEEDGRRRMTSSVASDGTFGIKDGVGMSWGDLLHQRAQQKPPGNGAFVQ